MAMKFKSSFEKYCSYFFPKALYINCVVLYIFWTVQCKILQYNVEDSDERFATYLLTIYCLTFEIKFHKKLCTTRKVQNFSVKTVKLASRKFSFFSRLTNSRKTKSQVILKPVDVVYFFVSAVTANSIWNVSKPSEMIVFAILIKLSAILNNF